MKTQQITAILLCALVGSTLGHDFLRAKRFAPEPRSSKLASPFEDRALAAPAEECTVVCEQENNGKDHLQIIFNQTSELVAIINSTTNVALIIDITTSQVGFFDGSNGAVVMLNLKAQTGVYIAGGLTKISWYSSQSTFEIFFSTLTSLQVFVNLKIGQTFTFAGISTETLTILRKLVISFSYEIGVQSLTDIRASLTIIVKITLSITTLLSGSLKGFFSSAGNGLIKLHGDLIWLGGVLEGFEVLFNSVSGGLAAVLAAKIRFDLSIIFGATNGLELFINILFAFAAKGKLSLLSELLSSDEKVLAIIVQLGGNVSTGVTGLFKVILHLYLLIHNKIKLEVFLLVLLQFSASRTSEDDLDLDIYIQALLKVIEISGGSSSSQLTIFATFVRNLQAGKLVYGKLNVSEIIVILQSNAVVTNRLQLVVSVLLKLSVIVGFGIAVTIPALLLYLLIQLNTAAGILLLNGLGIKITVSISGGNIIGQIIKGINIQSLLSIFVKRFHVEKLIESFPAFGKIYTSLLTALKESSHESYNLTTIIESSTSIQSQLLVHIKEIGGVVPTTPKPTTTTASHSGGILGGIIGIIFGHGHGHGHGSSSGSISVNSSSSHSSSSNSSSSSSSGGSSGSSGGTGGSSGSGGSGSGGSGGSSGSSGGSSGSSGGTGGSSSSGGSGSGGSGGSSGSSGGSTGSSGGSSGSSGGSGGSSGSIGGSSGISGGSSGSIKGGSGSSWGHWGHWSHH